MASPPYGGLFQPLLPRHSCRGSQCARGDVMNAQPLPPLPPTRARGWREASVGAARPFGAPGLVLGRGTGPPPWRNAGLASEDRGALLEGAGALFGGARCLVRMTRVPCSDDRGPPTEASTSCGRRDGRLAWRSTSLQPRHRGPPVGGTGALHGGRRSSDPGIAVLPSEDCMAPRRPHGPSVQEPVSLSRRRRPWHKRGRRRERKASRRRFQDDAQVLETTVLRGL